MDILKGELDRIKEGNKEFGRLEKNLHSLPGNSIGERVSSKEGLKLCTDFFNKNFKVYEDVFYDYNNLYVRFVNGASEELVKNYLNSRLAGVGMCPMLYNNVKGMTLYASIEHYDNYRFAYDACVLVALAIGLGCNLLEVDEMIKDITPKRFTRTTCNFFRNLLTSEFGFVDNAEMLAQLAKLRAKTKEPKRKLTISLNLNQVDFN